MRRKRKLFIEGDTELAESILKKTIIMLKEEFPLLIQAFNLLKLKSVERGDMDISTDGAFLFYNPARITANFHYHQYSGIRKQVMHVMIHLLLGHLEMDLLYGNRKLLWATMDAEVQIVLKELGIETGDAVREELEGDGNISLYFRAKADTLLRKRLYKRAIFLKSDEHSLWNLPEEKENRTGENSDEEKKLSKRKSKNSKEMQLKREQRRKELEERWALARNMLQQNQDKPNSKCLLRELMQNRKEVLGYGRGAGEDMELIEAAVKNQNSYYERLMQFLKVKEDTRELPDTIDPMLYLYGLEMYGDVPLIEPPETEEHLLLSTICIAIDSSGSCSGEVAEQFLRETYNLVRDIRHISSKCELYLFQCDDEIQMEKHYESLQEVNWEEWEAMGIAGWGGTSFEPVFDRLNELVEKEKTIDCLIYLTDSYGDCPKDKPEYPVFFILPQALQDESGRCNYYRELPDWIELVGLGLEEW